MIILWKKSLFVFWPSQKNVFRPKWQKWAKNSIQVKIGIFLLNQKIKSDFFHKKITFCFLAISKNPIFSPNWVFGPFLPLWSSDIFLSWSENKKWFFSQNNHFLFTEQVDSVAGKMCYSNTPKSIWKILLLRPTIRDFHSWFF